MTSEGPFDQAGYWIDRHKRLHGDPRSVGNAGKSLEDNLKGEARIKRDVGILARLLEPTCTSVLDLGCGYGRIANEFLERGFRYSGMDVSPEAISEARRTNPDGTFEIMDLNNWQPTTHFDVVCVFYVLVHFVDDEKWSAFLDRALRSVGAHGYFIFADEFPPERSPAGSHVVARPLSDYAAYLSRHGFAYDDNLRTAFLRESQSSNSGQFQFARRM